MTDIRYTKDHEWTTLAGDIATVGISDFAQGQLGDIVFVELPEVGKAVSRGDEACVVESVKAASEIYAPLDGEIVDVNGSLADDSSLVNSDALGAGWFVKIMASDPTQLDGLMSEAEYQKFISE